MSRQPLGHSGLISPANASTFSITISERIHLHCFEVSCKQQMIPLLRLQKLVTAFSFVLFLKLIKIFQITINSFVKEYIVKALTVAKIKKNF